jgi:hypothetical protein
MCGWHSSFEKRPTHIDVLLHVLAKQLFIAKTVKLPCGVSFNLETRRSGAEFFASRFTTKEKQGDHEEIDVLHFALASIARVAISHLPSQRQIAID